jgi:hypothetical protein
MSLDLHILDHFEDSQYYEIYGGVFLNVTNLKSEDKVTIDSKVNGFKYLFQVSLIPMSNYLTSNQMI